MSLPDDFCPSGSGRKSELDLVTVYRVLFQNESLLKELNVKVDKLWCCLKQEGENIRGEMENQSGLFLRCMMGMEDRIRAIEMNLDVGVIPLACTAEDNLNVASNKYVTDPNMVGKKEFR